MKHFIIMLLFILLVSVVGIGLYAPHRHTATKQTNGNTVSPNIIIVDDYAGVSQVNRQWYYTTIGTDRGAMGDGLYTVNIVGGRASVTVNSGWGGVWTAILHNASTNHALNPTQLLGPYIKSQYQPYITGVEIDIISGSGKFKIELKNKNNNLLVGKTFWLSGGQETLHYYITPTQEIAKLNWLVDGKGNAIVDEVRFVIESPNYTVIEAVFLFTYGHLCQCYDAGSGLVRDRAHWPVQDFAAIQTIGTFSLASAVAWDLGYISESNARTIIQKTKNTLLNLPRHSKGLLPHYLKNGNIVINTEWSSVDTVITLVAQILACQAIGEDTSPLEAMLQAIDWDDLTGNGSHSICMGYNYSGQKLSSYWDTFGAEALLTAIAYSATTGDNNVKLDRYSKCPTWDGSGFNDELAALFFPTMGNDIWGNNWAHYRQEAFQKQINYFSNHKYASSGFFGLSASEVPEPWTVEEDDVYHAWGVGGHNNQANDGSTFVGYPIIAPHYAAMIAAEYPEYVDTFFRYLLETQSIFSPMNNVESFGIDYKNNLHWNSLKGAWNLSLQVLGSGRALSGGNYLPYRALNDNTFLQQGFNLIMPPFITITSPNGGESWNVGDSYPITWTSTGTVGNVNIKYSTDHGSSWTTITASTANDGFYTWTVPNAVSTQCKIKISEAADGDPFDTNDAVFSITSALPPSIGLNRTNLYFGGLESGIHTGAQEVWIHNSGGGLLSWQTSNDAAWFTCSPITGTNNGIISVSIDPSGLATGTYTGTISITGANASNSPQTVSIMLTVKPNSQDLPPFGDFATPLDNATVSSSFAVTGWVLDDIGVENVKIYREDGASLVFIGDSVFVAGARPDVETVYPNNPYNYKAGWGYMLLSYFLPDGGNGVYKLHAIATDASGNSTILGIKTISVDNKYSVKPFGTIDTPAQGGLASSSQYINWGWVLTPQPNHIATNGSTINVWVDGVNEGHPTYNIYRSDIASLFPGYANSNGAIGYFSLDTAAYENGLHTIRWSASDSAGNADGIGSRYFLINHTAGDLKQNTGSIANPLIKNIMEMEDIPLNPGPVWLKQGYNDNDFPRVIYADETGRCTIRVNELERVQIRLDDPIANRSLSGSSGYMMVNNRLESLPVGSTFDIRKGIFYWQPGPGFVGEYHFVFILKEETGQMNRKEIIVRTK